jgi:hypothetical protein
LTGDPDCLSRSLVCPSRFDPSEPVSTIPRRHVSVGAPRRVLGTLTLHL